MEETVKYERFEDLKQHSAKNLDSRLIIKRHEEMENFLREIRKKWLEQKQLTKQT